MDTNSILGRMAFGIAIRIVGASLAIWAVSYGITAINHVFNEVSKVIP